MRRGEEKEGGRETMSLLGAVNREEGKINDHYTSPGL